ncbi:MAG TPA: DUF3631 domain-containing protein [Verrucomicrobiae bacterium]|jgi:hypothetical protein
MKNQNQTAISQKNEIQNQTVIFEPIAPHPEPVDVGVLLTEIETAIKRHVVLSNAAATALAVWVLHTYVYELRDTVAYVAIESPEKRCGKTTLLSVLAAMANKPLIASNVTVGALFRAIDTCHPTLFIDEADTFLAGSSTMRGVINSGNTWRTAYVLRLSKSKAGPNRDREGNTTDSGLQRYSCWCPKVIAMIGKVPDTIADRSIVVPMVRKLTTETRAPLAELNASVIKARCVRFAGDTGNTIAECEKIRGQNLNDRAADTFDPLYVIARLAGPDWEKKLHTAALSLSNDANSRTVGTELLLAIHAIFAVSGEKRMFTRDLLEILRDEDIGITSLSLNHLSLDESGISEILRPYGIKPANLRMGKLVRKGYVAEDFTDALARYVPTVDVEARIQEMEQKRKLHREVNAETEAKGKAQADSESHTA